MERALVGPTMRLPQIIALALSISTAACAVEVEGDDEPGLEETDYIIHNKLRTEDIVLNALTGTANAVTALRTHALATATFNPMGGAIPTALNDPHARNFMTYLVQCALDTSDVVSYPAFDGVTYNFRGKYGLCEDWADGAPTAACREIVTACILARNNMLGVEVALSVLGGDLDGAALPTGTTVPVKSTTSSGATMASFRPCLVAQNGPSRNCGWSTSKSLVGTCTPGANVTLNCTGGSGEIDVRVCDSPMGCDHLSARNRGEGAACSAMAPTFSFTCGADGAFSAMVGPVTSGQPVAGSFASATGGTFPATERQVFFREEGSFYGDFFAAGMHSSTVTRTVDAMGNIQTHFPPADQTVFLDAWACHDPAWSNPDAYMTDRLCALDVVDDDDNVADLCAADSVGPCVGGLAPACATGDAAPVIGDGDNGGCRDGNDVPRAFPLTTKLHQPCDLLPPGLAAHCERVR